MNNEIWIMATYSSCIPQTIEVRGKEGGGHIE